MNKCTAKHLVLREFYEDDGYSLNAFLISERADIDVKLAYQCISALVVSGYLRLAFACGTKHKNQRIGDFYEITGKGVDFLLENKTFCKTWYLPSFKGLQWQWRFPYLNFLR